MSGHVVGVGDGVYLFANRNIRVLESVVFHELEKDAVIHPSKGFFEVRVGCVYAPLGYLCIFVHHDLGGEAVMYVSTERNPSAVSLKMLSTSVVWVFIAWVCNILAQ